MIVSFVKTKPLHLFVLAISIAASHANSALPEYRRETEIDRGDLNRFVFRHNLAKFTRPEESTTERIFQKRSNRIASTELPATLPGELAWSMKVGSVRSSVTAFFPNVR